MLQRRDSGYKTTRQEEERKTSERMHGCGEGVYAEGLVNRGQQQG